MENPLITCTPSASNSIATSSSDATITTTSTTLTTVIPNEQNTSTLNSDANCESMTSITEDIDDRSPNCHSEVKSDTEDVYEFIEANGKKYRRHFQRRVVIERHKVREVFLLVKSRNSCLLFSDTLHYRLTDTLVDGVVLNLLTLNCRLI
ncbi:unnamed protein product [Schistosoma mattheei]|uniref:Uncharacterized protein n=1 Tax=Schistosoma mattheei TaxID=31246 RepID=A0A3P8A665_9TREM|nr:unnamed protein product [Schistosoma mattheei]